MITTIDDKIQHLRELAYLEGIIYDKFRLEEYYKELAKHLNEYTNIEKTGKLTVPDMWAVDEFTQQYFIKLIPDIERTFLRAYVIGRLLAETDKNLNIFSIEKISAIPDELREVVKKYKLTDYEVEQLKKVTSLAELNLVNTTTYTVAKVQSVVSDAVAQGQGIKEIQQKIREKVTGQGDLNRDWKRVAISTVNSAFNNAYLQMQDDNSWVLGISMPDACDHCMTMINNKIYQVIKNPPRNFDLFDTTPEEYKELTKIWRTKVWVGKNNIGRSTATRKRIFPEDGNKEDNLVYREAHEMSCPALPLHPNCFKGDVEIYTEKGWQRFDSLEKDIKVATLSLNSREMQFQKPLHYIENYYKGSMVRFYNHHNSIEATAGHEMLVAVRSSEKDRKKKFLVKKEAGELKGENFFYQKVEYGNITPKPVKIGEYVLSEELYAKLIGYYLSEGSVNQNTAEVKISQHKNGSREKIYNDILPLESIHKIHLRLTDNSIQFNDKTLNSYFKKLKLQPERFIPEEVKKMSKQGLNQFLEAYILGEGSVKVSRRLRGQLHDSVGKVIFTSSKQMADDLTEIVLKAGYSVSCRIAKTKGVVQKFRNGCYTINHDTYIITLKNSEYTSLKQREVTEYQGTVYCVEVPNGTILVRNKNFVCWTGNCRCRWINFNPDLQWIDKFGNLRLVVEDTEAHKKWYDDNILGT